MDEPWNGTTLLLLLVGCMLAAVPLARRAARVSVPQELRDPQVGFFVASAMLSLLAAIAAGFGRSLMAAVVGASIVAMLALLLLSPLLPKQLNIVQVVSALWSATWVAAIASFWLEIFTGRVRRLGPDEAERMVPCACFWVLAMAIPHVVKIPNSMQVLIHLHGLQTMLSSPHWGTHLTLAMAIGKLIGFAAHRPSILVPATSADSEAVQAAELTTRVTRANADDDACTSTSDPLDRSGHQADPQPEQQQQQRPMQPPPPPPQQPQQILFSTTSVAGLVERHRHKQFRAIIPAFVCVTGLHLALTVGPQPTDQSTIEYEIRFVNYEIRFVTAVSNACALLIGGLTMTIADDRRAHATLVRLNELNNAMTCAAIVFMTNYRYHHTRLEVSAQPVPYCRATAVLRLACPLLSL